MSISQEELTTEKKQTHLTKKEFAKATGVSVYTVQNWINNSKNDDEELKIINGKEKSFSIKYLENLLVDVNRKELISRLLSYNTNQSQEELTTEKTAKTNNSQDNLIYLNNQLKQENTFLKEQILDLKAEQKEKNAQIASLQEIVRNQQTLSLQQNQHTNLLLDKSKPKGFLSWFGINNQKEENQS